MVQSGVGTTLQSLIAEYTQFLRTQGRFSASVIGGVLIVMAFGALLLCTFLRMQMGVPRTRFVREPKRRPPLLCAVLLVMAALALLIAAQAVVHGIADYRAFGRLEKQVMVPAVGATVGLVTAFAALRSVVLGR